MSAGPAPVPGVEIVVGMPLGVDTPGRPPKMPPAPGKFGNKPPRSPGGVPSREAPEPGSVGTLVSTVGPCAAARSTKNHPASAKIRQTIRAKPFVSPMAFREPPGNLTHPIL